MVIALRFLYGRWFDKWQNIEYSFNHTDNDDNDDGNDDKCGNNQGGRQTIQLSENNNS